MKKAQVVIIPLPGPGHQVSIAEFGKRLIARDSRLSVTILTMGSPFPTKEPNPIQELPSKDDELIRYISLPKVELPPIQILQESIHNYFTIYTASHTHHVRNQIISLQNSSTNPVFLILDIFCSSLVDVAHELGIPSYVFFTSNAASLGLVLHLQEHYERTGVPKFIESQPDIEIPGFRNPVPPSGLPVFYFTEPGYTSFMNNGNKSKETNGIIINTFSELEPYAIESLKEVYPNLPFYTVGPVIDLQRPSVEARMVNWLDTQPDSSVVFLCFGRLGSFSVDEVKEIANGLTRSGQRFLWSLRKQITEGARIPSEYTDTELKSILPDEFRALVKEGRGMVCGWAPQIEILAHKAVGSFVTHCGWNSVLESVWFGKPIVALPLYAEQRNNAFELVCELGLATTWLGRGRKPGDLVKANEVENAVRSVMDKDNTVRAKIKEMSEVSRRTLLRGGSSFDSIGCLIKKFIGDETSSVL